jgi:hypothetical protein
MERLDAHGIPWLDYFSDLPGVGVLLDYTAAHTDRLAPIAQFFTDASESRLRVGADGAISLAERPVSATAAALRR